jgi:hypothetical protein
MCETGRTIKHRRRKRRNNETSNRNYDEGKDIQNRVDNIFIYVNQTKIMF